MKIFYRGENILNIPNLLSFYRLAVFPLILFFALTGNQKWFVVFICISLITDVLDGNIARMFKLVTRFGAALDNLADVATYAMAILGIFVFKWQDIQPQAWILFVFIGVFIFSYVVAFYRFGKIPGLHLYSSVAAGYIQGFFFFVLFTFGFQTWLYYIALGWGIIAYTEKIVVLFLLDDIRPGVKGLYWLYKKEKGYTREQL